MINNVLGSLALFFLLIGFSTPAIAVTNAVNSDKDPRIKTYEYHDDAVYKFKGHYGVSAIIEFSPLETIDSVAIGDSKAWQIVPSNKSNILFIKPVLENAFTNMSVLTSSRIYSFELSAEKASSITSSDIIFRVRFDYPQENKKQKENNITQTKYDPFADRKKEDFNFSYSYSGSWRLKPEAVFDDGNFTYFKFSDFVTTPAIFAVDEQRSESLVNFTLKDNYLIVTGVYSQLTLRDGNTATCIFNDSLQFDLSIQKEPKSISSETELETTFPPLPKAKPDFSQTSNTGFLSKITGLLSSSDQQSLRGLNR